MPWTIPNLLLHDKPVPLANMRSHGRSRVLVCCSNPGCHHNAELDVSRLADDVIFNDLQPRMVCTGCDHRSADVSPSCGCDQGRLVPEIADPLVHAHVGLLQPI
jgi:hypothetical protein